MCGCGTLFCRKCSPSAVLCGSCHEQHSRIAHARAAAFVHPAFASHAGHAGRPQAQPLTRRLLLESLLLTLATLVAMATVLALQNRSVASVSNQALVSYGIDAGSDPVQRDAVPFQTSIDFSDGSAMLTSNTSYSISARVESATAYHDAVSIAIPYDLLLSWGQLGDRKLAGQLSWTQSDRHGTVSGSLGAGAIDLSREYVISHISNNHIIPADNNIRQALTTVRPGDLVRIDGRLVDVRITVNGTMYSADTSKSRTDQGDGACEIIYAQHLRINDRTYD